MLLAGSFTGVDDLDTWDAVCVAWALLDERASATPETLNHEGSDKLRELLGIGTPGQSAPETMDDVADLRSLLGPKEVQQVTT